MNRRTILGGATTIKKNLKKMHVIGITGRAQAGKDTVAEMLIAAAPAELQHPHNAIVHFADPLKKILELLTGLPVHEQQTESQKRSECPPLRPDWPTRLLSDPAFWTKISTTTRQDTLATVYATPDTAEIKALEHFAAWRNKTPASEATVRRCLQYLGTECFRERVHTNYWLWCMLGTLTHLKMAGARFVVIADVRFDNEARLITYEYHGTVFGVARPQPQPTVQAHASEQGAADAAASAWFTNSAGLAELRAQVAQAWAEVA